MALGAPPSQVVRMLAVQSLRPVVLGVVLGTLGGIGLAAAMAAALAPIQRVLRLDPHRVLRHD